MISSDDIGKKGERYDIDSVNTESPGQSNNESIVIRSFKHIFSAQTLMLIATIIATFFGYKTYMDNRFAKISIMLDLPVKTNVISNQTSIDVFFDWRDGSYIFTDDDKEFQDPNIQNPFPYVTNKSNNSAKNFKIEVSVVLSGLKYKDKDINQHFLLEKKDSILVGDIKYPRYIFRNKQDVLHAKSSISTPLNSLELHQKGEYRDGFALGTFVFHITYDGINEPIIYYVNICTTDRGIMLSHKKKEIIDKYITHEYEIGHLYYDANSIVLVKNDSNKLVLIDKVYRSGSETEFEKFKNSFINKHYCD